MHQQRFLFALGCTLYTGTATHNDLPVLATWPPGQLVLLDEDVGGGGGGGGKKKKEHLQALVLFRELK